MQLSALAKYPVAQRRAGWQSLSAGTCPRLLEQLATAGVIRLGRPELNRRKDRQRQEQRRNPAAAPALAATSAPGRIIGSLKVPAMLIRVGNDPR